MDPLVHEWLNLIIRWAHVMFGIAWIGASLYFMWLDASLEPPDPPRQGVAGEVWSVHGGGFYRVEKFGVAPPALPRPQAAGHAPLLHGESSAWLAA